MLAKSLASVVLMVMLVRSAAAEADSEGWPVHTDIKDGDTYHYIVIGTCAGAVVANRLTDDTNVTVLLIEAGTKPSNASRYASNFPSLVNTDEDWQFKSEPEPTSQSQSGNVFKLAAGKTLGGSSQINHLLYLRGDKHDYNKWSKITDDPSWSFDNVLPYFLKAEAMKDQEILETSETKHNTEGPIEITREVSPQNDDLLKAFAENGHKVRVELNGYDSIGYAQPTVNNNVVRQSTAESYLKPIVKRKNLYVSYKSLVTKINIVDKVAVSVNVLINGKTITIKAKNEIILSAGVYNSPKLLMLSGIGPKSHLESHNITVIQDLPVGKNLQDHAAVMLFTKLAESNEVSAVPSISSLGFPIFVGAIKLDDSLDYPQGQTTNLQFPHDSQSPSAVCQTVFGYDPVICDNLSSSSAGRNLLITMAANVDPKSSGSVALRSTDPLEPPVIKLGYYSDPSDFDKVLAVIDDYMRVLDTKFFKSVKAELVKLSFDDCIGNISTLEYIRCHAKLMTTSLFHQTGTCSMGSVVDRFLKVYGIERLRVVDASVMPQVPTVNPLAAAIMIAEKASDLIKASNLRSGSRACSGNFYNHS